MDVLSKTGLEIYRYIYIYIYNSSITLSVIHLQHLYISTPSLCCHVGTAWYPFLRHDLSQFQTYDSGEFWHKGHHYLGTPLW